MAKTNKERQAAFKARQTNEDKRQLSVWISADAYSVLKQRAEQDRVTIGEVVDLSVTSNEALTRVAEIVTSNVAALDSLFKYNMQDRIYPNGMTSVDYAALLMMVEEVLFRAGLVSEARCSKNEDMKRLLRAEPVTSNEESGVTSNVNDVTAKARELAKAGLSLRQIGARLAEAGFVTRKGTPHGPAAVRTMLASG